MNARRNDSAVDEPKPTGRGQGKRTRFGPGARWLAIAGGIALVTSILAFGVWRQVRSHVVTSSQYQVDPRRIALTPPPAWIRSDIRDEVVREASLEGPLSLLDKQLTPRVASAFAAHPWIAHVERVSKSFPSGLEVEVAYRRPVAMVEVPDGALPVDVHGVVLPTADFRPGEADRYPRVSGISTSPSGLCGTQWGDAAVVGAAEVAAAFGADWNALGLFRIAQAGRQAGGRGGAEYTYAIFTRKGTRIEWGLAPGTTVVGDTPAADKIAGLKKFAREHGGLDGERPHQLHFTATGGVEAVQLTPVVPNRDAGIGARE
jgi:hypothetical protein